MLINKKTIDEVIADCEIKDTAEKGFLKREHITKAGFVVQTQLLDIPSAVASLESQKVKAQSVVTKIDEDIAILTAKAEEVEASKVVEEPKEEEIV